VWLCSELVITEDRDMFVSQNSLSGQAGSLKANHELSSHVEPCSTLLNSLKTTDGVYIPHV